MKTKRLQLFMILLLLLFMCFSFEIVSRFYWDNRPPLVQPANDDIFKPVNNSSVGFILKAGIPFYYGGAAGTLNSQGFRTPPVSDAKRGQRFRVVMVGDELVFGPGLKDSETLPANLERTLRKYSGPGANIEVINAGVPLYNFFRSASIISPLVDKYDPDVVLLVISEDDFDLQGFNPGGKRPKIFARPLACQERKKSFLGNLMLPDKKASFRYFLANTSDAYLLVALSLKGSLNCAAPQNSDLPYPPTPSGSETDLTYLDLASCPYCQARTLIWEPLFETVKNMQALGKEKNFKFAAVLYSDFHIRGRAALRLTETFERLDANLINLASYRKSEDFENKNHSLKWAPWPNSEATKLNALLLAENMQRSDMLPGAWKKISSGNREYEELADIRNRMYWDKLNEQEVNHKIEIADYKSRLDFSSAPRSSHKQLLYGWWPMESTTWLGAPDAIWMSDRASFILAVPKDVKTLHIEGRTSRDAVQKVGPVELSIHFECMPTETIYRSEMDHFEIDVTVPEKLRSYKHLEISILSHNSFNPAKAGIREDDNRVISVGFEVLELK